MKKYVIVLFTVLLAVAFVSPSFAQNEKKIKVNGVYTAWGLSQQKFFFGKNNGNDDYFVQMLRFKVQAAANKYAKANKPVNNPITYFLISFFLLPLVFGFKSPIRFNIETKSKKQK